MSDITTFVIGLVVCMAVAVLLTIVQMRLKKKAEAKKASSAGNQGAEKKPAFTVGRIYQMEDGSLAKYIGDNKFVKVKEK